MARRMMSDKVIDTDVFMEMPPTSQNLYFHLILRADDDGFVAKPKTIQKMCNASPDDYKLLTAKKFIIEFESGISVIKHWLIHNLIRADRYTETQWIKEKSTLEVREDKAYTQNMHLATTRQPDDTHTETQVRLGKVRLGKVSIKKDTTKKFVIPSVEEVSKYCTERGNNVDASSFVDFYTSKGWKVGREPMKDWKASVRTWERRENKNIKKKNITIIQ